MRKQIVGWRLVGASGNLINEYKLKEKNAAEKDSAFLNRSKGAENKPYMVNPILVSDETVNKVTDFMNKVKEDIESHKHDEWMAEGPDAFDEGDK